MPTKVSIIIPVYNTQVYLKDCLESIINQSFKDIEIICINDGSTDGSLGILKEYANMDNRILIINKENGGQALARNIGLQSSQGKYIVFVDSDDWVDLDMVEKLYNYAEQLKCDLVFCEIALFNEKNNFFYQYEWCKIPKRAKILNNPFHWLNVYNDFYNFFTGPFGKIYRKDLLLMHKIEFPVGLFYEDSPFVYKCLLNSRKIYTIEESLYKYRFNRTGSTLTNEGKLHYHIFEIMKINKTIINEKLEYRVLNDPFIVKVIKEYIAAFMRIHKKFQKDFFYRIKEEFHKMSIKQNKDIPFGIRILFYIFKKFGWFPFKALFFDKILVFVNSIKKKTQIIKIK